MCSTSRPILLSLGGGEGISRKPHRNRRKWGLLGNHATKRHTTPQQPLQPPPALSSKENLQNSLLLDSSLVENNGERILFDIYFVLCK